MAPRTWWEWSGICHAEDAPIDPECFFEIENAVDEGRMADPMVVSAALFACSACQVQTMCLEIALSTKALGIWGGTTASERGKRYRLAVL